MSLRAVAMASSFADAEPGRLHAPVEVLGDRWVGVLLVAGQGRLGAKPLPPLGR